MTNSNSACGPRQAEIPTPVEVPPPTQPPFAATIACYATILALRFRTQQAAPLMQAGAFMMVLFTTSYAPLELLTGWFQDVARYNPVRFIVEGVRQMSVYGVDWTHTWKAVAALAGISLFFGGFALRGLNKADDPA